MACMCGDTYCFSCGPAQGNPKCSDCQVWYSDGGCEHIGFPCINEECPESASGPKTKCHKCQQEKAYSIRILREVSYVVKVYGKDEDDAVSKANTASFNLEFCKPESMISYEIKDVEVLN